MSSVVVLQARTSSSRLPGKVLLPVCGLPLAVLAARRAANTGRKVIVATSAEASDDVLADALGQYEVPCYRGSLERVLDRMLAATEGMSDETVFIRLTADNVFPDGKLIDEVEGEFLTQGADYLRCNGMESGLPYGMSVEVTRLGHLREAARNSDKAADQEHVTPYVIRKYGSRSFKRYQHLNMGHYRCTVDNFDDYRNICRVFNGISDPVSVGCPDLIERLHDGVYQPSVSVPVADLVVGTAQLGMDYGIANRQGAPSQQNAEILLKTAIANGAAFIDTARAYGNSEAVIGRALAGGWQGRVPVITKLSPLSQCSPDTSTTEIQAQVNASLFQSCMSLGVSSLDVLMLHRASHLHKWQGALWQHLLQCREEGLIKALGASLQTPQELLVALKQPEIQYLQLPFNMLDTRWDEAISELTGVKEQRPLTVHVRSSLLQGLLVSRDRSHWQQAGVRQPEAIWAWQDNLRKHSDSQNLADLCIRYVRSLSWVDGVVVGMESPQQLEENLRSFERPLLESTLLSEIDATRPLVGNETLDPTQWRKGES
jgi:spore coat polysaccharide biosynthesis protein SpsF (cytidylyltransferase family)/aryl-alcohol dehydrogenase-like predicted oxidoreductase